VADGAVEAEGTAGPAPVWVSAAVCVAWEAALMLVAKVRPLLIQLLLFQLLLVQLRLVQLHPSLLRLRELQSRGAGDEHLVLFTVG